MESSSVSLDVSVSLNGLETGSCSQRKDRNLILLHNHLPLPVLGDLAHSPLSLLKVSLSVLGVSPVNQLTWRVSTWILVLFVNCGFCRSAPVQSPSGDLYPLGITPVCFWSLHNTLN